MDDCILPIGIIRLHLLYTIRKGHLEKNEIENISNVIMIGQQRLYQIIDDLEKKGYISRHTNEKYAITNRGNEMLGQAMLILQSNMGDLFQEK